MTFDAGERPRGEPIVSTPQRSSDHGATSPSTVREAGVHSDRPATPRLRLWPYFLTVCVVGAVATYVLRQFMRPEDLGVCSGKMWDAVAFFARLFGVVAGLALIVFGIRPTSMATLC